MKIRVGAMPPAPMDYNKGFFDGVLRMLFQALGRVDYEDASDSIDKEATDWMDF